MPYFDRRAATGGGDLTSDGYVVLPKRGEPPRQGIARHPAPDYAEKRKSAAIITTTKFAVLSRNVLQSLKRPHQQESAPVLSLVITN